MIVSFLIFLRRSVKGKQLMHFQSENVVHFSGVASVDGALTSRLNLNLPSFSQHVQWEKKKQIIYKARNAKCFFCRIKLNWKLGDINEFFFHQLNCLLFSAWENLATPFFELAFLQWGLALRTTVTSHRPLILLARRSIAKWCTLCVVLAKFSLWRRIHAFVIPKT